MLVTESNRVQMNGLSGDVVAGVVYAANTLLVNGPSSIIVVADTVHTSSRVSEVTLWLVCVEGGTTTVSSGGLVSLINNTVEADDSTSSSAQLLRVTSGFDSSTGRVYAAYNRLPGAGGPILAWDVTPATLTHPTIFTCGNVIGATQCVMVHNGRYTCLDGPNPVVRAIDCGLTPTYTTSIAPTWSSN